MTGVGGRLRAAVRRVLAVALKELRQLTRDRLTLGFIVGIPSLQLVLFGYAINLDVRHVPTAVLDRAESPLSRHLIGELAATQTFDLTRVVRTEREAFHLLEDSTIGAVVVVPPAQVGWNERGIQEQGLPPLRLVAVGLDQQLLAPAGAVQHREQRIAPARARSRRG